MASEITQDCQEKARQEAHALLDLLPDEKLSVVRNLLEIIVELPHPLTDDEPVTEEDRQRIEQGRAYFARGGKGIPMGEILAEFGLTQQDLAKR